MRTGTLAVLAALCGSACDCGSKGRPLSVTLTTPAASLAVSGDFPVAAAVANASGAATVTFTLAGTPCATATAAGFGATCALGAAPDGPAGLVAHVTDGAGRTASSAAVAITISRPLVVTVTAPAASATVTGDFPVTATVTGYPAASATVVFTLAGAACTGALASPFAGTCALGSTPDGAAALVATAAAAGRTASSAPVSLTIARPAPTAAVGAALEGSVWLERGDIPVAVTATNAVSVALQIDGATVATRTAPPFTFTVPKFTLLPGAHTARAVATGSTGPAVTSAARNFSVALFPYGPRFYPLSEMEDGRFPAADGRWLAYGAHVGGDGFGDLYFLRVPGGQPAGPFANAELSTATSDLLGNFYFWVKSAAAPGTFELNTASATAAPSVLLTGESVTGRLVSADDGHGLAWQPADRQNIYTVASGARVVVASNGSGITGFYARKHSVTVYAPSTGGYSIDDIVDGAALNVGIGCGLVDEMLFATGETVAVCGGSAVVRKPGVAAVQQLVSGCITYSNRFAGVNNLQLVCNPGTGAGLYYLRDFAAAPVAAAPIDANPNPTGWATGSTASAFLSGGVWKLLRQNGAVSTLPAPFDTSTSTIPLDESFFTATVPDSSVCGSYQVYDPDAQAITAIIPCDTGVALGTRPGAVPQSPRRHFRIAASSFGAATSDVYTYASTGPAALKLFAGLPVAPTIVGVPDDAARALITYIDTTGASPVGHALWSRIDGTSPQSKTFTPGADAAGQTFGGFSRDGSVAWYVSDIVNVTSGWAGTLHLVPADGGAESTVAVGGPAGPSFSIWFAVQGATGVATAANGAGVAFNGSTSLAAPAPAAPLAAPRDGSHLYYQSVAARFIDLAAASLATTDLGPATYGSYGSGTWATYLTSASGALLRLSGISGGPLQLAASGSGAFTNLSDLLEDEGNYYSSPLGTGAADATDRLFLLDTCGPDDTEACLSAFPQ